MSHTAADTVWRGPDGDGYVGRRPPAGYTTIATKGQTLDDETVAELGLEDLEDHTDYDAIIATATKAGAPITVRDEKTGRIKSVVKKGGAK